MFDKNILKELNEIKKALREIGLNHYEIDGWISSKSIQRFFNYSESNMALFEKNHNLTIKKINRRKFYRKAEITQILNGNNNQ